MLARGIDGEPVSRFTGVVGAYEKSPTVLPYAMVCGQRNAAMPWEGLPPHRIVSRSWCLWVEEAPLSRGRGCPPTALLLTGVLWGRHVLDMSGWEFSGEDCGVDSPKVIQSPQPYGDSYFEAGEDPAKTPLSCLFISVTPALFLLV